MSRRKKEEDLGGSPEWMTTYSDLMTLLLCFFIMLFSMAIVDQKKFEAVSASISNSFLKLSSAGDSILPNSGDTVITVDFANIKNFEDSATAREKYIEAAEDMVVDAERQIEYMKLDDAKSEMRNTFYEKGISDRVQITEEKDFLLVRVDSEVLFESGSAQVGVEGQRVLSSLADTLRNIENEILVMGHTDNIPIHNLRYDSNWELSTARATNVVTYFVNAEELDPELFTAAGNGEFKPISDNNTAEGRQNNRRIEIRIIK